MEGKEYYCEKCDYKTKVKHSYEIHLETEKHKTGKNKTRIDKKLKDKCPHCDFTCKKNLSMEQHILNKHASKKERKEQCRFYCEECDYGTFNKYSYDNHLSLQSHLRAIKKD
jgi:hypothetical protein